MPSARGQGTRDLERLRRERIERNLIAAAGRQRQRLEALLELLSDFDPNETDATDDGTLAEAGLRRYRCSRRIGALSATTVAPGAPFIRRDARPADGKGCSGFVVHAVLPFDGCSFRTPIAPFSTIGTQMAHRSCSGCIGTRRSAGPGNRNSRLHACGRLETVDVDDRLGEGGRRLLRQVVADAAGD